jgi:hypothetical protein
MGRTNVKWFRFWNPESGIIGGLIAGIILGTLIGLLLWALVSSLT